jgi:fused signal recognition particle receptor
MSIFSIFGKKKGNEKEKGEEKAAQEAAHSASAESQAQKPQENAKPQEQPAASKEKTAEKSPAADKPQDSEAKQAPKEAQKAVEKQSDDSLKTAEKQPEDSLKAAGKQPHEAAQKPKASFFERLKRTRQNISYGLDALVHGKKISEDLYEDLETSLLTADLGVDTTEKVIEKLREQSKLRDLHDAGALKDNLREILNSIVEPCAKPLDPASSGRHPFVILMVGVNGAGKTTTIGKLAGKFLEQGLKVMLAAGDTFRAAAVEQLQEWGRRAGVPVVAQATGSDSASVIYDALNSAIAKKADVLICDTAGRLQNKENLMDELRKIVRVMKKIDPAAPDEVMLVLDATTGQNAVSQVKLFSEAVNVTGITVTKLDGTAKGGVVYALCDEFKIPLRFVGIGEKAEDLRIFEPSAYTDAIIG